QLGAAALPGFAGRRRLVVRSQRLRLSLDEGQENCRRIGELVLRRQRRNMADDKRGQNQESADDAHWRLPKQDFSAKAASICRQLLFSAPLPPAHGCPLSQPKASTPRCQWGGASLLSVLRLGGLATDAKPHSSL